MTKAKRAFSILLVLILVFTTFGFSSSASGTDTNAVQSGGTSAGTPDYTEFAVSNWVSETLFADAIVVDQGEPVTVEATKALSFDAEIPEDGEYYFALKYTPKDALYMDCAATLSVDGDANVVSLPLLWADASSEYKSDLLGNQLIPEQVAVSDHYIDVLRDNLDIDMGMFKATLTKGKHSFSFTTEAQDLVIDKIYIQKAKEALTYAEYCAQMGKGTTIPETTVLEAEDYSVKSDSFIRAGAKKNAALYPYNTYSKFINVIDETSWKSSGDKILWEFTVENTGWYEIALRYIQNSDTNKLIYRKIEIDGAVPFKEWEQVPFSNTAVGKYGNAVLKVGDENAAVYLEAGKHTLAMTATLGPLKGVYSQIVTLMEDINALGRDIQKITAGQTDQNRTWNMEYYLPNAVSDLQSFAERINGIYDTIENICGKSPSFADSLKYASEILVKLSQTPNQIPNKTNLINQGDSSATKYLGNVLTSLTDLSLGVDRFYIGNTADLPSAKVSFFKGAWDKIKAFFYSFTAAAATDDYTATGADKNTELTVWVGQSSQYVQTLQELVDSEYNAQRGTAIRLSIMPSDTKLTLSNATGSNPDMVLATGIGVPFNFAIRNAAKNLLEYDDFLDFYNENYNLQSLVPTTYGEGVYGAVESQSFSVLFYRKDILDQLGLSVPNTWDDVKAMMPTLLRYGMNFYMPLSSSSAYKGYAATSPMVFQNGATYVSDDGRKAMFDSEAFIDAMTEMTEMYSIYGMQTSVPSFYNSFRNGEIPLGIAGYGEYIQLQMAAPELAGKWGIALTPGTLRDDGSISRYTPAAATASMIFKNTKKSEQAWDFLKWWLSTETQTKYAYMLQNKYGAEYRWNSANLKAFAQMPYETKDKATIIEQLGAQKELTRHPADYMIERETSQIWNNVVIENDQLIEAIDKATITTNREITRKLKEFGFYDADGNIVKDYSMRAYDFLLGEVEKSQKGASDK